MQVPYRLTFNDAVDIWLRHWAGEYQHKIAASYSVNQGRVNDVLNERLHIGSKAVAAKKRPSAA
jgi:predicted XRE-type DNA-binding protein